MSMKNIKFTGLLTRTKAVRYLIYVLFVCAFAVVVIKLNQVEKTELGVRTGQTFEKAKVVKILQDNLEENGTRVGAVSYTHLDVYKRQVEVFSLIG